MTVSCKFRALPPNTDTDTDKLTEITLTLVPRNRDHHVLPAFYRARHLHNNRLSGTIPDSLKIARWTNLYVRCTTLDSYWVLMEGLGYPQ